MKQLVKIILCFSVILANPLAQAADTFQKWQTKEGMVVYFWPTDALPMLDVQIAFDAGAARDGAQPGVSKLVNDLLTYGTDQISADEVAAKFDTYGAQVEFAAQRDMAVGKLRTLIDKGSLSPSIELFTQILSQPAFKEADFDGGRQRLLVALSKQAQSPRAIAAKHFYQALYQDQPYGNPQLGTEASLSAMTPKDLHDFHHQYYIASNANLSLVGAIDRKTAERIANEISQKLPQGNKPAALPQVEEKTQKRLEHVDFVSKQTHIYMGGPGITRNDPDYYPLYLGNNILGNRGMVSRLFKEIRETRGLAYDVGSYFIPMRVRGPFIVYVQTRNEKAQEAMDVIEKTVSQFMHEGPTAKELSDAKASITGGFPLRLSSNKDIAAYLLVMGFYQLPDDFLAEYVSHIQSVTANQIKDAFMRRLHPENFAVVWVGPKKS